MIVVKIMAANGDDVGNGNVVNNVANVAYDNW